MTVPGQPGRKDQPAQRRIGKADAKQRTKRMVRPGAGRGVRPAGPLDQHAAESVEAHPPDPVRAQAALHRQRRITPREQDDLGPGPAGFSMPIRPTGMDRATAAGAISGVGRTGGDSARGGSAAGAGPRGAGRSTTRGVSLAANSTGPEKAITT